MASIITRFLSKPTHLFRFDIGPRTWAFTGGDVAETVEGIQYLPAAISRGAIRSTTERAKNELKITMPASLDPAAENLPVTQTFVDMWRPFPPSMPVMVTCLAIDRSEPGEPPKVEWMGRAMQPKFKDGQLELVCTADRARNRVAVTGRRCQRTCDLVVYGQGLGKCNLSKDAHEVVAILTHASGVEIRSAAFAESPLPMDGGWIEWTRADGISDQRTIMRQQGDRLTLDFGAFDLLPGTEVKAWPGCDQSWQACAARNNTDNHGGRPYLPSKNPWSGNPL